MVYYVKREFAKAYTLNQERPLKVVPGAPCLVDGSVV